MSKRTQSGRNMRGREARGPTQITRRGWRDVFLRAYAKIGEDALTLVAAGVAFYAFLSLFPAITAFLSIYGLLADPAQAADHVQQLSGTVPPAAMDLIEQQMKSVASGSDAALGISLAVSVMLAVYSASKGTGAMITALNIVYDETEARGFIRLKAVTLALTLGGVLFVVALLALIGISGALTVVELPGWIDLLIRLARWAAVLVLMMAGLGFIYTFAPSRRRAQVQWATPGAIAATIAWLAVSIGFSVYVEHFGSYNKTYGSAAAIVVLLMWLWLSALLALVGAEINAALESQTRVDSTAGRRRERGQRGAVVADDVRDAP